MALTRCCHLLFTIASARRSCASAGTSVLIPAGLFARYSEWDNQAGGGGDSEYSKWDVGVNHWLENSVVSKFDYKFQEAPNGRDEYDGLNLGVGWRY